MFFLFANHCENHVNIQIQLVWFNLIRVICKLIIHYGM